MKKMLMKVINEEGLNQIETIVYKSSDFPDDKYVYFYGIQRK